MTDRLHAFFAPHLDSLRQATHCQVIERIGVSVEPMHAGYSTVLVWEEQRIDFQGYEARPILHYLYGLGWQEAGVEGNEWIVDSISFVETIYSLEKKMDIDN